MCTVQDDCQPTLLQNLDCFGQFMTVKYKERSLDILNHLRTEKHLVFLGFVSKPGNTRCFINY